MPGVGAPAGAIYGCLLQWREGPGWKLHRVLIWAAIGAGRSNYYFRTSGPGDLENGGRRCRHLPLLSIVRLARPPVLLLFALFLV